MTVPCVGGDITDEQPSPLAPSWSCQLLGCNISQEASSSKQRREFLWWGGRWRWVTATYVWTQLCCYGTPWGNLTQRYCTPSWSLPQSMPDKEACSKTTFQGVVAFFPTTLLSHFFQGSVGFSQKVSLFLVLNSVPSFIMLSMRPMILTSWKTTSKMLCQWLLVEMLSEISSGKTTLEQRH